MRTALILLIALCYPLTLGAVELNEAFRHYWYDQGAEISRYDLEQSRYGEIRKGHAVLVYVTEPFDKVDHVKSDNATAPTAVPALKINHTRKFNTGIYPYSVMQSVFQPLDTQTFPHVLKSSTSVQEWCGHVFEQYNKSDTGWERQLFSYFQSEGDVKESLGDAWLEDELWTRLRLDPQDIPQGAVKMIPSSLYHRFAHRKPEIRSAHIKINTVDKKNSQLAVSYKDIDRSLQITFETAFPHRIHSWTETINGERTSARKTKEIHGPYWQWNKNADLFRREELGLPRY